MGSVFTDYCPNCQFELLVEKVKGYYLIVFGVKYVNQCPKCGARLIVLDKSIVEVRKAS